MGIVKPNRLIAKLILISFFSVAGWGLVMPIFALYMTDQVRGGTIEMVGIAVGIYWIVKSVCQPFLAYRMDSVKGEHDDMVYLLRGAVIMTIVPLFFIFATEVWHVFLLEAIRGVGMAMIVPTVSGVFTRHINKDWESYMWSLQNTSISFAYGFSAIFGGLIAGFLGFKMLFLSISFVGLLTVFIIYFTIKNDPWLNDGVTQEEKSESNSTP